MKLWLDDKRGAPEGWVRVWSYSQCIRILTLNPHKIDAISFDYDLGDDKTGYDVACWIEEKAATGTFLRIKWDIHSANPVGRENIERAMRSAERFWEIAEAEENGGPYFT